MLGFGFSLMLETLQLIFMVGSFDVDDMQLNTLGAALGYLAYRFVPVSYTHLYGRQMKGIHDSLFPLSVPWPPTGRDGLL